MLFEPTFPALAHAALDAIKTLITSPFERVNGLKMLLFVPALFPFIFHW